MNINLKYFLIPCLAFSLTTAHASLSDSEGDEGASASTSSGPKVCCGHAKCHAKIDEELKGESFGLGHPFGPARGFVTQRISMSRRLFLLRLAAKVERIVKLEAYKEILRKNAPTELNLFGPDGFDLENPDVNFKGDKIVLTEFAFEDVKTEAKRRVLTLKNGTRLAFYESRVNALQFFVTGATGDSLSSTYFANEIVRFGTAVLSPNDGFETIATRLIQAGLMDLQTFAKEMDPQTSATEKVTVTYVRRLRLNYEMNSDSFFNSDNVGVVASVEAGASIEGVSNVNIIDPSFVPVLTVDVESEASGESEESKLVSLRKVRRTNSHFFWKERRRLL